MIESRVSAILLASGLSRRMGGRDKLLLPYRGETLRHRAIRLLESLNFYEKIVVTTPARLKQVYLSPEIRAIINPCPEAGQSGSLRLGVEAATGEWYLFLMADQPRLNAAALAPLLELAGDNPDKIIFPSVNGAPSSPTLFPARFRENLLELTGDTGGRAVRSAHPDACLAYEVETPESFLDVDNENDYKSLGEV